MPAPGLRSRRRTRPAIPIHLDRRIRSAAGRARAARGCERRRRGGAREEPTKSMSTCSQNSAFARGSVRAGADVTGRREERQAAGRDDEGWDERLSGSAGAVPARIATCASRRTSSRENALVPVTYAHHEGAPGGRPAKPSASTGVSFGENWKRAEVTTDRPVTSAAPGPRIPPDELGELVVGGLAADLQEVRRPGLPVAVILLCSRASWRRGRASPRSRSSSAVSTMTESQTLGVVHASASGRPADGCRAEAT